MKGMKIYGSFNADSYQEVSIDWLTVTLKYDNHGGGQAMLLTQGPWDEVRDRLIAYIEHKLDLTRPDEITEKTRIKGITELSNILTG